MVYVRIFYSTFIIKHFIVIFKFYKRLKKTIVFATFYQKPFNQEPVFCLQIILSNGISPDQEGDFVPFNVGTCTDFISGCRVNSTTISNLAIQEIITSGTRIFKRTKRIIESAAIWKRIKRYIVKVCYRAGMTTNKILTALTHSQLTNCK